MTGSFAEGGHWVKLGCKMGRCMKKVENHWFATNSSVSHEFALKKGLMLLSVKKLSGKPVLRDCQMMSLCDCDIVSLSILIKVFSDVVFFELLDFRRLPGLNDCEGIFVRNFLFCCQEVTILREKLSSLERINANLQDEINHLSSKLSELTQQKICDSSPEQGSYETKIR